jgi:hypothetical protein
MIDEDCECCEGCGVIFEDNEVQDCSDGRRLCNACARPVLNEHMAEDQQTIKDLRAQLRAAAQPQDAEPK